MGYKKLVQKRMQQPPELILSRGTTLSKIHTRKPVEPEMDNKMDIIIFSTGAIGTKISL